MRAFTILCLVAAVTAGPTGTKTVQSRAQVGDNNPVALGSGSQIVPACTTSGLVSLRYENSDAIAGEVARITIGTGDAISEACVKELANGETISTTADQTCNPTGTAEAFVYSVTVVELTPLTVGTDPIVTDYPSSFTVTCKRGAAASNVDDVVAATPANEGAANYVGSIPFKLDRGTPAGPRQWRLLMSPENGVTDLVRLSYRLDTLTAKAANDETKSVRLVVGGCPVAGSGVTIFETADTENAQVTTIDVRTFQFTGRPGEPVDFTATAVLCPNPTADGSCPTIDCTPQPPPPPPVSRGKASHPISKRAARLVPDTASVRILQ